MDPVVKRSKSPTIWTTRKGVQVRIVEMEDRHLVNTLKYLRRRAEWYLRGEIDAGYRVLGWLTGDMATYYAEQEISILEGTDPHDLLSVKCPQYDNMFDELNKRGLYSEVFKDG